MFKKMLVLVVLLLVSAPVLAETVDTAWVRGYNGPGGGIDVSQAIVVDISGTACVTGYSKSSGPYYDYATIKYASDGTQLWAKRYDGTGGGHDEACAIAMGGLGHVYVTGSSDNGANHDYVTIKYNPNGDTAWVRRYDGPGGGYDYARAIALDGAGNVYVTGKSDSTGTDWDYTTIKYNISGNQLWVKRYNGTANSSDQANAIAIDSYGDIHVTGVCYNIGTDQDCATIKYRSNGDTAWVRTYDGPANLDDGCSGIVIDGFGNVYVAGWSRGSSGELDYLTIKYDSSGTQLWVKTYNGSGDYDDYVNAIAIDNSGNIYVTGFSCQNNSSPCNFDCATIKYYPNGDTAWVRRYDGPENGSDGALDITVDSKGNAYVAGYSSGSGTSHDFTTIKYDSSGNEVWVERYNGPEDGNDSACAIAINSIAGNIDIYVTGYSYNSGTDNDYATIKYLVRPSGVQDEPGYGGIPSEFTLSQNYPNPFNQSTKIEFGLKRSGFVRLNIYDILGRRVRTLVSQDLSIGYKSILWDGKDDSGVEVASGTYFYKLKIGDFSKIKKLVLLK